MTRYQTGAHTTHRLRYHLVWAPKYRRRILTGRIAVRLRGILEGIARDGGWIVHELNVQADPVHMMLQAGPDVSVANIMQRVKGASSFRLRREFPELQRLVSQEGIWADGYFADSIGVVDEGTIRAYIKEQSEPDQSSN